MHKRTATLIGAVFSVLAACFSGAWAEPLPQPRFSVPANRSLIPTATSVIAPGPRVQPFEPAYLIPRGLEFADFNGDGLLDIVVAPGFPQHLPILPIAIWINNGDGTFHDGTAEVIEGAPPLVWNPTQILIGDFNNDGRPDVIFVSSGAEHFVADGLPDAGYFNTLLLSQPNGKYKDATSQIQGNVRAYNHQGAMGDANGDGNLDFVVYAGATSLLPGPLYGHGARLFLGDGKGAFTNATALLPPEVRWETGDERNAHPEIYGLGFQDIGCVGMADLDGDGKAEVITGSYAVGDIAPDRSPGGRTIRFHKMGTDGNYFERLRLTIPAALAGIANTEGGGLGCSQILAADFDGDGKVDLLVQWEGGGQYMVELLRNEGNFVFTDVTLSALGTYDLGFSNGGGVMGPGHFRILDVNGDNRPDIVGQLGGTRLDLVLAHVVLLNDGTGHFTPWSPAGPSGPLTAAQMLSATQCASCNYVPMVFDTNKSGIASLVLLDFESLVSADTPSQTTGVYLTTFAPTNSSYTERLFAWAEARAPQLFSPATNTFEIYGFSVRAYAGGIYLGMHGDDVYVYGPPWGPQLVYIGKMQDYLPFAVQDGF